MILLFLFVVLGFCNMQNLMHNNTLRVITKKVSKEIIQNYMNLTPYRNLLDVEYQSKYYQVNITNFDIIVWKDFSKREVFKTYGYKDYVFDNHQTYKNTGWPNIFRYAVEVVGIFDLSHILKEYSNIFIFQSNVNAYLEANKIVGILNELKGKRFGETNYTVAAYIKIL